jgi:hypothetical protein
MIYGRLKPPVHDHRLNRAKCSRAGNERKLVGGQICSNDCKWLNNGESIMDGSTTFGPVIRIDSLAPKMPGEQPKQGR